MASQVNKPTGLGYSSGLQRKCGLCKHKEIEHYGKCLYHPACDCKVFTARELDPIEREILAEDTVVLDVKYVGEAWLDEFVEDFKKRG